MKKMKKLLICILAIAMILALGAPVVFAEPEDAGQTETPSEEPVPTEEPTPAPDQTAEPTPEPPTAAPTQESAGTVDITIFAYDADNYAAEGYTVQIDATKLTANSEGRVDFPGVTVEQHDIRLVDKDGVASQGVLVMSRGGSTVVTDAAMGGKYGLNVANGVSQIYINLKFNPQAAVGVEVSENKPAAPSAQPSASASQTATGSADVTENETKQVTATFVDEDGNVIESMGVTIQADDGAWEKTTDSKGKIELDDFAYGTSRWDFDEFDALTLEMAKGVQTSLTGGVDGSFRISVAPRAEKVYLEFEQAGDAFILKSVSESAAGGISTALLVVIIVVIAVVVIVVVVNVRKKAARQQMYTARTEEMQYRRTGGANKFENRRDRGGDFDDRSRM